MPNNRYRGMPTFVDPSIFYGSAMPVSTRTTVQEVRPEGSRRHLTRDQRQSQMKQKNDVVATDSLDVSDIFA